LIESRADLVRLDIGKYYIGQDLADWGEYPINFMGNLGRACTGVSRLTALAFAIVAMFAVVGLARAGEATATLEGNHPDEAAEIAETGAPPSRRLTMHLTMALRTRTELDRTIAEQQDPSSPEYHRWLTSDEFNTRFGPTEADIAKVTRWLKRKGFTVQSADVDSRRVTFTGTVASAEKAFGVKIAATANGALFANTGDPVVPTDLAPMIESIRGLDNLLHSAPALRGTTQSAPDGSVGDAKIHGITAFGPNDLYTFYDEPATPDGSGTDCIALIEDSNFNRNGADAFNSTFNLAPFTSSNLQVIFPDGRDPGLNADANEAMVDVNYSHAIAPGVPIRVYIGNPNTSTSPIPDAIRQAVKDNACGAIGISFSFCGATKGFYKGEDGWFARAASQGQAVFVASGDTGAAVLKLDKKKQTCVPGTTRGVNELAASPHVTAVGGTQFTPNLDSSGNDTDSVPESAWNDGGGATGGGQSKIFKRPSWQAGLFKKDKKRDLPDISFAASPFSPGFFFGDPSTENFAIGGTSIGAPSWAGISELISEKNGGRIGNLNVRLYQLGAMASPGTTGIRDVTSGDNAFNGAPGFSAVTGFDKATGWGTVDIGLFVPAFLAR
jgi:subtilase family serine protease